VALGQVFSEYFCFPWPILIPPTAPHSSSIIRSWYNRPISGRRTKWTVSPHPKKLKKKKTTIVYVHRTKEGGTVPLTSPLDPPFCAGEPDSEPRVESLTSRKRRGVLTTRPNFTSFRHEHVCVTHKYIRIYLTNERVQSISVSTLNGTSLEQVMNMDSDDTTDVSCFWEERRVVKGP
jgi:hypothetical protein